LKFRLSISGLITEMIGFELIYQKWLEADGDGDEQEVTAPARFFALAFY